MVTHPIFRPRNRFPRRRVIHLTQGLMLRRLVCFALVSSLLVLPGDCLSFKEMRVLASALEDLTAPALRYLPGVFRSLSWFRAAPRQRESLADRIAHVAHIQIAPRRFVGYQLDSISSNALATRYGF